MEESQEAPVLPRRSGAAGGGLPRWALVIVAVGGTVALLLLGAAAGLLIGMRQSEANALPGPDSVDVGFCQDMSVHHRQAATMAALARQRATEPKLRTLAFDIESTQLEQIGRMQGWLSLWGRDRLPPGKHMTWMSAEHAAQHGSGHTSPAAPTAVERMPGMATPEELGELSKTSGPEFDVRFLQLMLRHHQGGTAMLRFAADHAEVGVVRNLAKQMLIAQGKEVEYMLQLLAQRNAQPLPN
jgi:uncharacterized protein (DUF305 family)